jgi:hypothetical protein
MTDDRAVPAQDEEGVWCVTGGDLTRLPPREVFRPDEVENLTYDNPYGMEIERVWFDGKIVFAVESGEVEIEFNEHRSAVGNKVAQEYQVVYGVELDERGKLAGGEPDRVEGQYNIYDSVPGMRSTRRCGSSTTSSSRVTTSPTPCARRPTACRAATPSRKAPS